MEQGRANRFVVFFFKSATPLRYGFASCCGNMRILAMQKCKWALSVAVDSSKQHEEDFDQWKYL